MVAHAIVVSFVIVPFLLPVFFVFVLLIHFFFFLSFPNYFTSFVVIYFSFLNFFSFPAFVSHLLLPSPTLSYFLITLFFTLLFLLHIFTSFLSTFPSFVSSSLFNFQLFPLFASLCTSLFINLPFFSSSSKSSPLGLLPFHSPPSFSLARSLRLFFSSTSYFLPRLSFPPRRLPIAQSFSFFISFFSFLFSSPPSYSSFSILPFAILLFLPLLFISFSLLRIFVSCRRCFSDFPSRFFARHVENSVYSLSDVFSLLSLFACIFTFSPLSFPFSSFTFCLYLHILSLILSNFFFHVWPVSSHFLPYPFQSLLSLFACIFTFSPLSFPISSFTFCLYLHIFSLILSNLFFLPVSSHFLPYPFHSLLSPFACIFIFYPLSFPISSFTSGLYLPIFSPILFNLFFHFLPVSSHFLPYPSQSLLSLFACIFTFSPVSFLISSFTFGSYLHIFFLIPPNFFFHFLPVSSHFSLIPSNLFFHLLPVSSQFLPYPFQYN
ncbi:unnamed protein product [Acanthosepion pharaonis]|uniref:Uncharacterized protein n=1 Tax=Acanthosepion pharaonis TaxID=158019 RepID=A0A812C688_ACAPH|nr:unnamed protein product [Sepia pharaonis]